MPSDSGRSGWGGVSAEAACEIMHKALPRKRRGRDCRDGMAATGPYAVRGRRVRSVSALNSVVADCSGFTITTMRGSESYTVRVASEAGDQQWTLTTGRRGREWLIAIADHDGNRWAAEGPDLFEALRVLRSAADPLGIRLGVNGARRDAWASGMQRDMGEGRFVYLLTEGETGRPPQVSTLGPASLMDVGTVREQEELHARWLSSRRRPQ
jgi:hypothetical protein